MNARPRRWKMGKFASGSEGDAFRLGPDQAELKHADGIDGLRLSEDGDGMCWGVKRCEEMDKSQSQG